MARATKKQTVISKSSPADLSILKEYAGHDLEAQRELVSLFYTQSLEDLERLFTLVKKQPDMDGMSWPEVAHLLKGSAAYMGAVRLVELCRQAQKMETSSADERRAVFEEIQAEHIIVCEFLRQKQLLRD